MSPRPRLPARPAPALLAALALAACEPAPPAAPRPPAPPPSPPPAEAPAGPSLPRGHLALAAPRLGAVPFVLQPIPGGRSALAIAQVAGERAAWVRRLSPTGPEGPPLRLLDRRVLGAVERADGALVHLTSDGARICLQSSAWPGDGATCVPGAPAAIVPVGDRLALLDVTAKRPPEPARVAPRPPTKAAKAPAPKKGDKRSGKKKTSHAAPSRRVSHPLVEISLRWVDPRGVPDPEPHPTGLHFEAPLDGMTLVDARPRPPGVDLLWYETAPGRRARTPLGSGRLMAGSLRADGTIDLKSRVAVVDADVEHGHLKDHRSPRLVGSDAASVFLATGAKGECEALRVLPTFGRLTPPPSACALAPDRLGGPLDAGDVAALERLLGEQPRRAFGQPKSDLGLAAWAGDRAYYLSAGELRSAGREGPSRAEAPPFPARRARIAWGALTPDGEGLAQVDDQLVHVDARTSPARLERLPAPRPTASEIPVDRRRAARIGATFWLARGGRARLFPDPGPVAAQPTDTSVLVGGAAAGLSLELAGAALGVDRFAPDGAATRLAAITPAPVRAGFDACERGLGGALVAGVSAADPTVVVAFSLSPSGQPGAVHRAPLPIRAGELAVRLVPLPAGGALLLDLPRRHVVWLDDDARPLASGDWAADESDAACLDGRPVRRNVPAPTPGAFLPVPDTASDLCVVGDPVWGADGHLRWLGSAQIGLDVHAEVVDLPLLPAASPLPVAPAPAPSPPLAAAAPARCPADMVSVAARFCVDRFESALHDARTGEPLSPDYPATPGLLDFTLAEWATGRERVGNLHARAFPLPWISPARVGQKPEPLAVPRLGARPSGYVTGVVAEAACAAAGKRLCTLDEFVTACRGEADTLFPYGETYEEGVCNVFREEHPAALLHDNASVGHLDPRLNRVTSSKGRPLLQRTGESPACRSRWGDDAIYDMVGNLDEWVNEGNGAFAGGFYARSTRSGCEALVTAHPKSYLDYSTGVRCCRD